MMDQGKRLVINTISNYASLGVNAVVGFFLAPYILTHLGKSSYGIWALTGSLLGYSQLLSLGLNSAVNRWVPMYLVEKNTDGINRVVNTTLFFYLLSSVIGAVGVAVLVYGFPDWFHVPPSLYTASRLTVALVGAGFIAVVTLNVFSAVLSGLQRYDLTAASDITSDLGRCTGIVAVLSMGYGLVSVAAVFAATIAVRGLLKAILAMRTCVILRINLRLAQWRTFRDMFGYSISTLMYTSGQLIQRQAALILIGLLFGTTAVTEYAMPLIIISLVVRLVMSGSAAMKPAATHLDTLDRPQQVRKLYLLGTKYALLIALPAIAFFIAYAGPILRIWLREGYMASGPMLLSILAGGAAFYLWHLPAFFIVVGMGKHRMFGVLTLVTAALSLLAAIILGVVLKMGVVGVAIGFSSSQAAIAIFLITPYCCRCVGMSVWRELSDSLAPALLATLPFVVLLIGARLFFQPDNISGLLGLGIVLVVPLLFGWWFWGFSNEDKLRFVHVLPMKKFFNR